MNITTKYNVGDEIWLARVYTRYNKESVEIDGKRYDRTVPSLDAFAKKKIIVGMTINIDSDNIKIRYICREPPWTQRIHDRLDGLANFYDETETRFFSSEEDAAAFAKNWKNTNGTDFYG